MIYYAIKHVPTGKFLPVLTKQRKRGFSFTEPTSLEDAVPRLHLTCKSATAALRAWLKGTWKDSYDYTLDGPDYCGPEPTSVPSRHSTEFEVVRLEVSQ